MPETSDPPHKALPFRILLCLQCLRTVDKFDRLGVRREEFLLLKAILVSNCDVKVEQSAALSALKENLLAALYDCVAVIRCPRNHALITFPFCYNAFPSCEADLHSGQQSLQIRDTLSHNTHLVPRSGNPTIHVQNLLLVLPSIRQADALLRSFWNRVHQDNKVTLNKLLVEMLDASK